MGFFNDFSTVVDIGVELFFPIEPRFVRKITLIITCELTWNRGLALESMRFFTFYVSIKKPDWGGMVSSPNVSSSFRLYSDHNAVY